MPHEAQTTWRSLWLELDWAWISAAAATSASASIVTPSLLLLSRFHRAIPAGNEVVVLAVELN